MKVISWELVTPEADKGKFFCYWMKVGPEFKNNGIIFLYMRMQLCSSDEFVYNSHRKVVRI